MKKKILTLCILALSLSACSDFVDYSAGPELDDHSRGQKMSDSWCKEHSILWRDTYDVVDESKGIPLGNGLYLTAVYRGLGPDRTNKPYISADIEIYNDNPDTRDTEYMINGLYQPVDTMAYTNVNRILNIPAKTYQSVSIQYSIGVWTLKIRAVTQVGHTDACGGTLYNDQSFGNPVFYESKVIWTGEVTVGRNNDYIRRTCEKNHACDGPTYTETLSTLCADGWASTSRGSGTCSHHGGIAR